MTWQPAPPQIVSATADTTGAAVATYQPTGIPFRVEQISVSVPGASGGSADVALDGFFLFGTVTGWADSADGPPPVDLGTGQKLTITWAGVPAGSNCIAVLSGSQDV